MKSTALAWKENTSSILKLLASLSFGLWGLSGYYAELGIPFYPSILASHIYLLYLINKTNINDPKTCW